MSTSNNRAPGRESSSESDDVDLATLGRRDIRSGETQRRSGTPVHRDMAGISHSTTGIKRPLGPRPGARRRDCRNEDQVHSRLSSRRATYWILLVVGALSGATPLNASEQCRLCHPDEVREYLRTGMGRSLSRPDSVWLASHKRSMPSATDRDDPNILVRPPILRTADPRPVRHREPVQSSLGAASRCKWFQTRLAVSPARRLGWFRRARSSVG